MDRSVAGVDEAGRGALAGPVVAAAVILGPMVKLSLLGDSKQLTLGQRERAYAHLRMNSIIGLGIVSHRTIDRINILNATLLAMTKAIWRLSIVPDQILIDGNRKPNLDRDAVETVVKGDQSVPCIGAASIVAKVIRDILMRRYNRRYEGYGFDQHKGYGTWQHYQSLSRQGPSLIHRKSFKLSKQLDLF